MESQQITIHRALAELKLIDSKIDKGILNLKAMAIYKQDAGREDENKSKFEAKAKSDLASIKDLTDRRFAIKKAIVASNAITKVKVGKEEMTVAEAITMKSFINTHQELIVKLTAEHRSGLHTLETENAKVEVNMQKLLEISLGKDNVKANGDDVKSVSEAYKKQNQYSLLDPLGIEKEIETLTASYEDFYTNVDASLSESNAITIIEIK